MKFAADSSVGPLELEVGRLVEVMRTTMSPPRGGSRRARMVIVFGAIFVLFLKLLGVF